MRRGRFDEDEDELLIHCYGTKEYPVAVLSDVMERSVSSIYQRAARLGLTQKRGCVEDATAEAAIQEKHALGWTDSEIARHLSAEHGCGVDRHRIGALRSGLGLGTNAFSDHRRRQVAERTKQQLQRAGLPSIGHLRVQAYNKWKRNLGWPESLTVRAVQALELFWRKGPMTRLQLCESMGIDRDHAIKVRTEPKSNAKGGTVLAELQRADLVMRLPKQVKAGTDRRGGVRRVDFYLLCPGVEPNEKTRRIETS
ncbi:MAG: hypothetical protein AAGJ83_09005 [Planctomycetota bacterium]